MSKRNGRTLPRVTPVSDRRPIVWSLVKTPSDWIAILSGTFFGSGLLPKMPGTWGSLFAIPLVLWTNQNLTEIPRAGFWIALAALGSWSAARFQKLFGAADNQNIVIDEAIGMGVSGWICQMNAPSLVTVFVLFRFFDIVKIPPVRAIDRWSKDASSLSIQGFGVMADDIAAGFQALLVYAILQKSGFIPGL